jgi:hypothetical protein
MRAGLRVLVWDGAVSPCGHAWIEAGARPFAWPDDANRRLTAQEGEAPDYDVEPEDGEGEPPTPYASAQQAIDALSRLGRVPDRLASRLRQSDRRRLSG